MYSNIKIYKKLLPLIFFFTLSISNLFSQKVVHYDLYVKDTLVNYSGKTKRAIAVNGHISMPTLTFTEGDTAEIVVHNVLKESTSLHWHGLLLPNQYDGVPYLTQMPIWPGTNFTYRFPIIQNGTHWYHSHSGLQEQIGMYGSFIMLKKNFSLLATADVEKNKEGEVSALSIGETFGVRPGIDNLPTIPLILSEWTDYNPHNVHRMLHNATDWFAIKKNTVQSYAEAIKANAFKIKVKNEWKRMLAMDVSDIYYDKILINGKNEQEIKDVAAPLSVADGQGVRFLKAGDKVRLRISNGGASSYFWLTYAGGKITVVANDGNDVQPVEVDRLLIAVSETYDLLITIPNDSTAYEFLVTTEDRTNSASIYIGNGIKQTIAPLPKLKYFEGMKMMNGMMKNNGRLNDMGMNMSLNQMDMNVVMYPEITGEQLALGKKHHAIGKQQKADGNMKMQDQYNSNQLSDIVTLNYAMLKSPKITTLPTPLLSENGKEVRLLKFELTGNMNRYIWSMDNKVLSETDKILIKKGENIRIILYNGSMMRHPMHLHGHDFRLLNGQGDYAPLKNIVDIMPMETDTLEFNANAEGDWFFHCHVLYHMMSGMGRVFTYKNQAPNPYIANTKKAWRKIKADDKMLFPYAENDFATNGNDGMAMLQNTRWSIGTEWRLGYNSKSGYEVETHVGRYIGRNQWFMPFIGFDWRYRKTEIAEQQKNIFGQANTKDKRAVLSAGFEYTLPMLVKWQAEAFTDGKFRMQLFREDIPIAKRVRAAFMLNTDKEFMLGLRYIVGKNFSLSTHYDSDMGLGAGVTLNY